MKKIFLLLVAAAVGISCDGTIEPTPTPYATDSLTVSANQNVLLVETTGAWCQYCPNGAAMMRKADRLYDDRVIAIASHTGDALETPIATLLNINYPTTGVPNFYVNNTDAGQNIDGPLAAGMSGTPEMGVATAVEVNDSTIDVYAKVQVFTETRGNSYFVQSYLMLEGLDAKTYGLIDLNQTSSVSIVQTGSGATPSVWTVDTVGKKAGDTYQHEHLPLTASGTSNPWGVLLDTVNPLGNNFFVGDIFGTEYTPIVLKIRKSNLVALATLAGYSSVNAMMADPKYVFYVNTIVWKLRQDGTTGYLYVNGVHDNID